MTEATDLTALAARLATLEAHAELWNLIARYANAVDDRDYEALGLMFTDDAVFDSSSGDHVQGATEVVDYLRIRAATDQWRIHAPTQLVLTALSPSAADGIVSGFAVRKLADGGQRTFGLRYRDRYHKTDSGWRFHRRAVYDIKHIS